MTTYPALTPARTQARKRLAELLAQAVQLAAIPALDAAITAEIKSVEDAVAQYEVSFYDWVDQTLRGRMSKVDLARAMRALIRSEARVVYVEGLEEGGVPEEDMSDADETHIDDWIQGQLAHVAQFAADVVAASKLKGDQRTAAENAIARRVDEWVAAFRALGTMALMSAKGDQMATWRYGETDHCETCQGLHGKRRRLSWFLDNGYIPREPGSATLDCHGFFCQCGLYDDKGRQLVP
jgi:hypothetical protein